MLRGSATIRYSLRVASAALAAALVLVLSWPTLAGAADVDDDASARLIVDTVFDARVVQEELDGRLLFLVADRGQDPLSSTSVDGQTRIFGQNVNDVSAGARVTMEGGGASTADTGVYGWPFASLDDLPVGDHTARAFFVRYDTAVRGDGSTVQLYFPCGDGGVPLNGPGNLQSDLSDFSVTDSGVTSVSLTLSEKRGPVHDLNGSEPGGCLQSNWSDYENVRYVKVRSEKLSQFWGRDMYVGANVRLPANYDPDRAEPYPVIYSQSHWPAWNTAFWNNGGDDRFIFVTIRQESPYYDSAYAVNSANVGPWGDAIAEELVPELDRRFNTIAAPYGRLQEGGSTGGWSSIASLMFRPDVYGATWSYYPDSLDFGRHQAVNIYADDNAYVQADGSTVGSWRDWWGNITVSMERENHYELALATKSRSFDQWDIWNAVFAPQGYNGYPLEAWDKATGDIDHDAASLWREQLDLSAYLRANWSGQRNLGMALKDRIHVSVGDRDAYYLDGGVELFQQTVESLGGNDWADITVQPDQGHSGFYENRALWDQLNLMYEWVQRHSPGGETPLSEQAVAPATEGNTFEEVMAWGGRAAAIKRQADPVATLDGKAVPGATLTADFGAWDPGMSLSGQWMRDGVAAGEPLHLERPTLAEVASATASHTLAAGDVGKDMRFAVTAVKQGYDTEVRYTEAVRVETDEPSNSPPVPDEQLTLASRGGVDAPEQAVPGSSVSIAVPDHEGQKVRIWLHSTPVLLGEVDVSASGRASVEIPASASLGAHRVVVQEDTGELIGWDDIRLVAAAPASPTPVPTTLAPTRAPRGPAPLAATGGAGIDSALVWSGTALLLAGVGGVMLAHRNRRTSHRS